MGQIADVCAAIESIMQEGIATSTEVCRFMEKNWRPALGICNRQGGISILTRYTDLKMSEPTRDGDDSEFSDRASPRAIRRHHKRRMKAKAILIARRVLGIVSLGLWSDDNAKAAAKNADHLASCSCAMCCNPRRSKFYSGKSQTRKEMQAERDLRDSVE